MPHRMRAAALGRCTPKDMDDRRETLSAADYFSRIAFFAGLEVFAAFFPFLAGLSPS